MYGVACAVVGVMVTVNGHMLYQLFGIEEAIHSEFKHYRPAAKLLSIQLLVSFILALATLGWAYSIVMVKKV